MWVESLACRPREKVPVHLTDAQLCAAHAEALFLSLRCGILAPHATHRRLLKQSVLPMSPLIRFAQQGPVSNPSLVKDKKDPKAACSKWWVTRDPYATRDENQLVSIAGVAPTMLCRGRRLQLCPSFYGTVQSKANPGAEGGAAQSRLSPASCRLWYLFAEHDTVVYRRRVALS